MPTLTKSEVQNLENAITNAIEAALAALNLLGTEATRKAVVEAARRAARSAFVGLTPGG